jgi:hypothetical protein
VIRRFVVVGCAVVIGGCAAHAAKPAGPPPIPLHLEPACDVAPAAGLSWIVELEPRAIAMTADLIPAIGVVFPEERFNAFERAHGGIDLRQTKELCIARYKDATLVALGVPLDPERVASAFEARSVKTTTRTTLAPNPHVLRITGAVVDDEPQELTLFGREALVLELADRARDARARDSRSGLLRVAEAFAFGKLKRAVPALHGSALARASEVLGPAPVRAFSPGPFTGDAARALGGLLGAATAVAASAKWAGTGSNIAIRVVVTGAWGDDAKAAAERLGAAGHVLSESPTGHLFGLDHPKAGPSVHVEPDALVLDETIDGDALARGIHDAVDADIGEIMRR